MVPFGAIGLVIFALYPGPRVWPLFQNVPVILIGLADVVQHRLELLPCDAGSSPYSGISGGFYTVPLYAMMQAHSPAHIRLRVWLQQRTFLNAVFMVSSAIFSIIILSVLELDLKILFCITAVLSWPVYSYGCFSNSNP